MFLTSDEQKKIYKEIFPYSYYNKQNYIKNIGNIDDAFNTIHNETKENYKGGNEIEHGVGLKYVNTHTIIHIKYK
jgi:hypothetical protein